MQQSIDTRPSLELAKYMEILQAYNDSDKTLRFGQFFHQQLGLEKMTSMKVDCDRIHNEPDQAKATGMIKRMFDIN